MKRGLLITIICFISAICFGQNLEKYDQVFPYYNGFAKVRIKDKFGYIDSNKKQVVPCKYRFAHEYIGGYFCVAKKEKYVFLNEKGKKAFPIKFYVYFAGHFSEGIATVRNNSEWGAIDTTGKLIIPFIYTDLSNFESGIAIVKENGKYHFINKLGENLPAYIENDAEFDMIFINQYRINNGYVFTKFITEGLIGVMRNDKWGFVDTTSNIIIPFKFDKIVLQSEYIEESVEAKHGGFQSGKCLVKIENEYFYIDKQGTIIEKVAYNENFLD